MYVTEKIKNEEHMKIVISPAKSLDFETAAPTTQFTEGIFYKEAEKLNGALKKKTPKKLSALMSISSKLGEMNWQRNQDWQLPFSLKNAKQAVYAFKGDVYVGLEAHTIPLDKMEQLQHKLRILSGQYGLLKPLDLMQPYRLEMGTKLKIGRKNNLYQYWGSKITDALNSELTDDEVFVNLASNEYFKVIKPKLLKTTVGMLSEGQKGLLCYARFVLQKPHVLILDEPTNHINFRHLPIIAEALNTYE